MRGDDSLGPRTYKPCTGVPQLSSTGVTVVFGQTWGNRLACHAQCSLNPTCLIHHRR
jgi:hypothetical protein